MIHHILCQRVHQLMLQLLPGFQQQFGSVCSRKTGRCTIDSSHLAMLNSIPLIGFALGVLFVSWLGEKYGRRVVFVFLNCTCLVGVGITYSSKSFTQILIGRCLVQAYVGMENWLIPMYQSEIVPANIRGAIVGNYFTFKLIGSMIMAAVTNKTRDFDGSLCWKIPIAAMFVVPAMSLLLCYFIPESPRWLLRKGNREEAHRVLEYIYDGNPNASVDHELQYLQQMLNAEPESGTWADLFRGTNRVSMMALDGMRQRTP